MDPVRCLFIYLQYRGKKRVGVYHPDASKGQFHRQVILDKEKMLKMSKNMMSNVKVFLNASQLNEVDNLI